ncbi:hypothetical protein ACNR9W_000780 [Paracoccus sp. T5]
MSPSAHAQACGDDDQPRLSVFMDKLCNQLGIIFGQFVAPCFTHALNRLSDTMMWWTFSRWVRATPTFFLNGRPLTNPSFETLSAAVRNAVAETS